MRHSMYLEPYLDDSDRQIAAGKKPRTPGTFLGSQLRGFAKQWADKYLESLIRSLEDVGAVKTPSKGGSTAYRRLVCKMPEEEKP